MPMTAIEFYMDCDLRFFHAVSDWMRGVIPGHIWDVAVVDDFMAMLMMGGEL